MSLYNSLFGVNHLATVLLKMLGIDQKREDTPEWPKNDDGSDWYPYDDGVTKQATAFIQECRAKGIYESGRFRDIYLSPDGEKIILYTRNGGGNRESYPHIFSMLQSHPNFITDYDDDFDCTYCYYEFSVPDEFKEDAKNMTVLAGNHSTPSERFKKLIEDLESGNMDNPDMANAMKVGEKVVGEIKDALDSGEDKIITV